MFKKYTTLSQITSEEYTTHSHANYLDAKFKCMGKSTVAVTVVVAS